MQKRILAFLSLLIVLSMVLSACSGSATPTAEPTVVPTEAPVPTEVPTVEPTAVPTVEEVEVVEAEPLSEDYLDQAYSTMLDSMKSYNTIIADVLMEELVSDNPPFMLDVRTTEEVEANGHIEGAVNVPLSELALNLNVLPTGDSPIVTYCGSGWRATIAMTALQGMGFTNVRALKTSFDDWVAAGNPVVEGLPNPNVPANMMAYDPSMVAAFDAMLKVYGAKPYGGIDAEGMNTALVENPDLVVIDVRKQSELDEQGYIEAPNFISIPLEEFVAKKDMWPASNATIAIYCGSGHRSTIALTILGTYGYNNVSSLKGGFGGWAAAGYPVIGAPVTFDAPFEEMLSNMSGYNTIKADGLMEALVSENAPFLLDVRTTAEVEENGHIEGAINIPLNELAQNTNLLPSTETPIVTYCGSGWRATIAMTALYGLGWENVKALKTAFADWVDAGNPVIEGLPEKAPVLDAVTPDEGLLAATDAMLQVYGVKPFGVIDADGLNTALVENPDLVVIDVRTQSEVDEKGTIEAASFIHIPLEEFAANQDMWPATDADIVVYCGSGHRSTMALTMLGDYGYSNVSSLKDGFGGWVDAGFPVAMSTGTLDIAVANTLATMQAYNTIKADGLMEAMVTDQPPFLLDVRTAAEVEENGHIEGAVNIPLDELAQNLDKLPAVDVPIVTYCGSGWRATIAMTTLSVLGWQDVKALKTSFQEWVDAGNPVEAGPALEAPALEAATPDESLVAKADTMLQVYGLKPFGVIDDEGLNTALVENPDLVVIDVRTQSEVDENGVIDTADAELITIPLEEFVMHKDLWPVPDSNVAVYCGSGHRSTMALTILGLYGYDTVSSLKGGFGGWVEAGFPVTEYAAP